MSYKVEIPCGICQQSTQILNMRVTPNPLMNLYVWVCGTCWKQRPEGTVAISMELNELDMFTIHRN